MTYHLTTVTATRRHGYTHTQTYFWIPQLADRHQVDAARKYDRQVPLQKLASERVTHLQSEREERRSALLSIKNGADEVSQRGLTYLIIYFIIYLIRVLLVILFCAFIHPRKVL